VADRYPSKWSFVIERREDVNREFPDGGRSHSIVFSDRATYLMFRLLKVARLVRFIDFIQKPRAEMREQASGFADELFDAHISRCMKDANAAYAKFMFRAALKARFFELYNWWRIILQ
jgi:hypothetical protein